MSEETGFTVWGWRLKVVLGCVGREVSSEEGQGHMGEWEGESQYAWGTGVGLPQWALEKTETWTGPTMEEALSRQHGQKIHGCHHVTRAWYGTDT